MISNKPPVVSKVNAITKRSPARTGKFTVAFPSKTSNALIIPVMFGAKFTKAFVAVNVFDPAGARYSCALIVAEPPGAIVKPTVSVNVAEILVTVPLRGTLNASVKTPGNGKTIVSSRPTTGAAVPNPTKAAVPATSPNTDVKATGVIPEENAMIEPELAPVGGHQGFVALNGPNEKQGFPQFAITLPEQP